AGGRAVAMELEPVFDQCAPMTQQDWLVLLNNQSRRNQAIHELAAFDDPKIAATILRPYRRYLTDDRQAAMATLSSRISFARPLVYAIKNRIVPRTDLSAFHARQIHNLGDEELNELLQEVWGRLRQSPEEKRKQIEDWQTKLASNRLGIADVANGKKLFQASCTSCHSIFGEGGNLGPDLNGSDRQSIYYLLENLIDPSAVLPQDYKMNVLTLKDGRVLSGNIIAQSRHSLTLAGLNSVDVIPMSEVVKQERFEQSIMPEGLLQTMSEQDVVDLIGYLQQ
ncbi:MAG: c-type cytochrome, partial [Opitutales bacterium]|nr:c-type cytochrome [Opitutales bacterium]